MTVIGLTGSIGMGKTTVANMLRRMGYAVHDFDQAARFALSPKGEAFEEVALTFPEVWNKKKHIIKRDVLADVIFKDSEKKEILENILHPIVQKSQKDFIAKKLRMDRKNIVLDIPLLFETGTESKVDYTFVVDAPYHVQRNRVLKRNGMTEEKFLKILESQMPNKEKCLRADFVIPTGLGMAYTQQQLTRVLDYIS